MEDYDHPATASINEYLHTSYRPDVDYVDGELQDRLWGEFPHSAVRTELLSMLRVRCEPFGMKVLPSIRVRVSLTRIRIADVAVLKAAWRKTQIIEEAPALCIEVVEPQDDMERVQGRCRDFLKMGVPEVWIFDPEERTVFVVTDGRTTEQRTGTLQLDGTEVQVNLEALFAVLDEGQA